MRKAALAVLFSLALAAAGRLFAAAPPHATVLVELFTSQGCSSCVNSGALISALDQRPHVLALTFPVDYWDYLGWRDTLAKPEFSERQRLYMRALALRDVYTPQVVVDGRLQAAAVDRDKIDALVREAGRAPVTAPRVLVRPSRVRVSGQAPAGGAAVWLVRYQPGDQSVKVLAGDNRGRTIVEHNVVRELVRLGVWRGRIETFRVPPARGRDLDTVVIVQGLHNGRVFSIARV
ncbi:MAG TPA: DUF1223 domain-containing protein [Caulobacteraceae bacterium]|nr:DUF1223 domain-containing protein [Caulobacteraceae bacterium]